MPDIVRRFSENPLLKPADIPPSFPQMEVECLLNPGAFRFQDKTWLLLRVAERPKQTSGKTSFPVLDPNGRMQVLEFDNSDEKLDLSDPRVISYDEKDYLTTMSHLRLVSAADGKHFSEPVDGLILRGEGELETFGVEDCRVAQIGSSYYLTFTEVSESGVGVGLRSTSDWKSFERHGMIFSPHNKDCALFEEKIDGKYYALHRPSSPEIGGNYIWIAESLDLNHWGNHRCIIKTRAGAWDSKRVGAGASPILTNEGWLEIYHGANEKNRYCLGAFLLDLHEPWKVIARSADPIMEPLEEYERNGFFGEVVFTNGHVVNGDDVTIYYGASDSVVCGAQLSVSEILNSLSFGDSPS